MGTGGRTVTVPIVGEVPGEGGDRQVLQEVRVEDGVPVQHHAMTEDQTQVAVVVVVVLSPFWDPPPPTQPQPTVADNLLQNLHRGHPCRLSLSSTRGQ